MTPVHEPAPFFFNSDFRLTVTAPWTPFAFKTRAFMGIEKETLEGGRNIRKTEAAAAKLADLDLGPVTQLAQKIVDALGVRNALESYKQHRDKTPRIIITLPEYFPASSQGRLWRLSVFLYLFDVL